EGENQVVAEPARVSWVPQLQQVDPRDGAPSLPLGWHPHDTERDEPGRGVVAHPGCEAKVGAAPPADPRRLYVEDVGVGGDAPDPAGQQLRLELRGGVEKEHDVVTGRDLGSGRLEWQPHT